LVAEQLLASQGLGSLKVVVIIRLISLTYGVRSHFNEVIHGFLQSVQENVKTEPNIEHGSLIPNPNLFITHHHLPVSVLNSEVGLRIVK
jgi:hypothetical protein